VPRRWDQWLLLRLYQVTFALVLLVFVLVVPLWVFSSKRRATLFKRLGWQHYPRPGRPTRRPLWIHALSIGELLSAGNLIQRLRREIGDRPLYLSVSTASAFAMAQDRFRGCCDGLFYFPYDVWSAVSRCFETIDPSLVLLIETDIWPLFLEEVRRRQVPCLLVNGRLSPGSFRTYRRLRRLFEPAFNSFHGIYPQSPGEAERYLALGVVAERLRHVGNLKFDVAAAVPNREAVAALREEFSILPHAPVLIAGSTHRGEEEIIRSCFVRLRSRYTNLQLIVVPRHPQRASEVVALFQGDDAQAALASARDRPQAVVVVDRMGYLSRLYALADVAVIGGSFVRKGGQNPIEPAACGKPVLFGPDMHDFPDVAMWLVTAGGAIQVENEGGLYAACDRLLSEPEEAKAMGERARRVVAEHQGATERVVEDVLTLLTGR
jgi:3-deoxy-D-manno-octulosonic-acid transferase